MNQANFIRVERARTPLIFPLSPECSPCPGSSVYSFILLAGYLGNQRTFLLALGLSEPAVVHSGLPCMEGSARRTILLSLEKETSL